MKSPPTTVSMHLKFSNKAEADLKAIHTYISERNPDAAQRIVTSILMSAYQLEKFPFLGKPGRVQETRELTVPRTPYIIVYWLPDEYHIDVLHILHDRQQWPPD